jgi:16S rRNA (uracil1498-N3)-methyltransferase
VASIQPLVSERSVLRLKGERAEKKVAHWRGVAIAACEQCGRNRPPQVHAVMGLAEWASMQAADSTNSVRLLLSLSQSTQPLASRLALAAPTADLTFMSGPEGGLSPAEEARARSLGFEAVTLGSRVLRAETAPLACLAWLSLLPAVER